MEEKEALKRQIDFLQSLIDKSKRIQENRLVSLANRNPASAAAGSNFNPHFSRGQASVSRGRGSWKKTYSLRNKHPPASSSGLPTTSIAPSSVAPPYSSGSSSNLSKPVPILSGHAPTSSKSTVPATVFQPAPLKPLTTSAIPSPTPSNPPPNAAKSTSTSLKPRPTLSKPHLTASKTSPTSFKPPPTFVKPVPTSSKTPSTSKTSPVSSKRGPTTSGSPLSLSKLPPSSSLAPPGPSKPLPSSSKPVPAPSGPPSTSLKSLAKPSGATLALSKPPTSSIPPPPTTSKSPPSASNPPSSSSVLPPATLKPPSSSKRPSNSSGSPTPSKLPRTSSVCRVVVLPPAISTESRLVIVRSGVSVQKPNASKKLGGPGTPQGSAPLNRKFQQTSENPNTAKTPRGSSKLSAKSSYRGKASWATNQTFQPKQTLNPRSSTPKKSKFIWVRSPIAGRLEPKPFASGSPPTVRAVPPSGQKVAAPPTPLSKKTHKKKLSHSVSASKTSKYRWVSSARVQTKTPRKYQSPKTWPAPPHTPESARKVKAASLPFTKPRKGGAGSSQSNRYRWKAGSGHSSTAAAPGGSARRTSAFKWTAERNSRVVKVGLSPNASPLSCAASFKLRSRTKIIRRSASSAGGSDRGKSPRGRTPTRSPLGPKRTASRELVPFGRHKLRRLSNTAARASPASFHRGSASSCHRSPASQRFSRARCNLTLRQGSTNTLLFSPTSTWSAKKVQTAKSFLQNRQRSPQQQTTSDQRWAESQVCWIRGSLFRVSANKLSRTCASPTGRIVIPPGGLTPARSTTRHLASRAVQRSLAIIRHARQKKQQKQYCIFYSRFGKCNRGDACPFIHDPEKVAVCTRFLRGTCKKAEGVCLFSHKVSKEKMPVCSYFLKGVCNNTECPYSHVYVSDKADVCEDFINGYCPEGQKCKRKHTLVCADFSQTGSCPRGARCKQQHRQQVKRSAPITKLCPQEAPESPPQNAAVLQDDEQGSPGTSSPRRLPSFISLCHSPEETDTPDRPTANVKEAKLQIKPRL